MQLCARDWGLSDFEDLRYSFQRCDISGVHGLLPRMHEVVVCSADPEKPGNFGKTRDIVFYHVFKSGGTSVANMFEEYCFRAEQRSIWAGKRRLSNFTFPEEFVFTLVREPVSRLLSSYHEVRKRESERAHTLAKWGQRNLTREREVATRSVRLAKFREFLSGTRANPLHRRNDPHWAEQVAFLTFANGNRAKIDFIGALPDLEHIVQAVLWDVQHIDIHRSIYQNSSNSNSKMTAKRRQYQESEFGVAQNANHSAYRHARTRASDRYTLPMFVIRPDELSAEEHSQILDLYKHDQACFFTSY